MQVVLLKTVKKIGRIGEVINVKEGYATNFLFPQKLAVPATASALKEAEVKKANETLRKEESVHFNEDAALRIKQISALRLKGKVTPKGTLYQAVTAETIAEELLKTIHLEIPTKSIHLDPIKALGTHEVKVQLGEKSLSLNIVVEAQE